MSNKLIIKIDKTTISNDKIYQEGFELAESLCSQSELRFGCCESSVLKLKIRNEFGELNGKTLDVLIALNGDTENLFKIGTYKVETCERSGDRQYLNITAYDKMYDIINANVTEWYDSLTFPLSMKAFRDSFFAYINVSQETTVLTQDSVIIEKTIDADEISGLKVISAICELNGAFGNVDKNGVFKYIFLEKELEPIKTYAKYVSCEYEDFTTKPISKVQVRQEEGDIGAISGTGDNTYIVNDNFLVYGKSPSDLSAIADRLFAKIKGVSYIPFKATVQGDPCVEVGDVIKISTKTKEVTSYLLERTIKGIQSLKDSFESKGVYEYSEKVNSANKETRQLKGKVNKLTRTVEETVSEIKDLEKNIDTKITQTAEEIFSEASKKFVTEESIEELQRQIDGAIETFTGSAVPTVSNYPTIEWVTSEEKDKHIGDLFIVNDKGGEYAGFYYRFEKNDSAYSWVLLKDNEITKALQDSKEANEKSEEAKKKALEVEKSLADNYITETEVKSAIKQSAEEISTSVSKTYSTKSEVSSAKNEAISSANTNAANQLKNYSTTTQMNSAINQSAESIKSTVASTYTTKEDFKNLEVGGRNLIRNSAFLSGKKRWTFGTNVTLDMEKTFNGHPTVKSEQSGLTSSSYRGVSNYYLPNNPTSVSAGETYTISCWYYVEDASLLDKHFILEMKGYKPEAIYSTKLGGADFTAASCAVGQWTKLQKTFTVNADYKNCFIYVSIERNGIVWFADLKLEKGAKATDWTPAPEDSESEIAEVKTIATQTADKFSWIVDSGTSASNFAITDRLATLTAQRINLNGLVTFSGLDNNTQTNILNGVNALNTANSIVQNIYKDNTTMIDGGKIATNTITADKINTTELFAKQITLSDNVVAYPTLQDVDIIQKIMLGKITPTEAQKKLYDFNADGTISLVDVVRAQRLISGATTYGEHPEYQAPTGMATVDINFKNPEKIISIVTISPFAAGTAKTSIGANKVETTRVLCDSLTAKRAELMPVNDEYEGGEIQLNGVGDYEDVVVDNYKGTLRIFDTNTAKPIVFDLVNNNITGGYSFDGGLSGTFSTSGLSIISGRATIISGGYYKSSGMVFVQMNIKLLTGLGTNEWWGIASGFPKPRNNYVALAVSTVDSLIGVVNASIENSLLCIRTSDGMVQGLTANQILTFTGIYLT